MRPIYPAEKDFERAFAVKVLRDSRRARYLLSALEQQATGGRQQVVADPNKVNLEHVLPKNPSQHWKDTIESIGRDGLAEYTYRLGNLALVSTVVNKQSESRSFE